MNGGCGGELVKTFLLGFPFWFLSFGNDKVGRICATLEVSASRVLSCLIEDLVTVHL